MKNFPINFPDLISSFVCTIDGGGSRGGRTMPGWYWIILLTRQGSWQLLEKWRKIEGRWSLVRPQKDFTYWISAPTDRPTNQHHRTSSSSFHLHEHEWPFVVAAAFSVIHLASFQFILLYTYMHIYWVKCKTWLLWPDPPPLCIVVALAVVIPHINF